MTITKAPQIPLVYERIDASEMAERARTFRTLMTRRRSVREFSTEPVDRQILEDCIAAAAQAPSGANKQPWTFVLVTDPELKRQIREGAEAEERAFYGGRAGERWLRDLEPLDLDANKPFLETAPALIVIFAQRYGSDPDERHYYVQESVGIAAGFLIAALHNAGLVTLTHTPSPMKFLGEILHRPKNERPYLLLPVGYPASECTVPEITRKELTEVLVENLGG